MPLIDPIFDERDEPKRIAAAKKAARYVVEKGYVVPLFQVVQPVVMKKDLELPAVPDRRADPAGDVLDVTRPRELRGSSAGSPEPSRPAAPGAPGRSLTAIRTCILYTAHEGPSPPGRRGSAPARVRVTRRRAPLRRGDPGPVGRPTAPAAPALRGAPSAARPSRSSPIATSARRSSRAASRPASASWPARSRRRRASAASRSSRRSAGSRARASSGSTRTRTWWWRACRREEFRERFLLMAALEALCLREAAGRDHAARSWPASARSSGT